MGPVINDRSRKSILSYIDIGKKEGRLVAGGAPPVETATSSSPRSSPTSSPDARIFQEEIFGPVLAVTKAKGLRARPRSRQQLRNTASPEPSIPTTRPKQKQAADRFFVGNLYINRKCTGAMVGAHPFGGFNMSGTDSKAGGPDYLLQFVQAKSIAEKIA